MYNAYPLSGISGLSFNSPFLSLFLVFYPVLMLSVLSFFCSWPILQTFFPKYASTFFVKRQAFFVWLQFSIQDMTVDHMTDNYVYMIASVRFLFFFSFFLFLSLVFVNQTEGRRYHALAAYVYVCFVLSLFWGLFCRFDLILHLGRVVKWAFTYDRIWSAN